MDKNIASSLIKLEKRILALENAIGIDPDKGQLIHPKSINQYLSVISSTEIGMVDALHKYIYSHYDQGTQASLIMLYANKDTPEEIKTMIAPAGYWVLSVLDYYYKMKEQYRKTGNWIEPDYSQFDKTDPHVDLNSIVKIMVKLGG